MTLPKRPERSSPIPNQPFESPEVTSIRGPYWDMSLGSGLEADPYGSAQTTGSTPSDPSAYLYGSNGFVGVGTGLQIGPNGELEQSTNYIYCTPTYPELPVTYPPYGCNTEVNTAGVTDFTNAWSHCSSLTEFPCVDSSYVTNFDSSWSYCYGLTSFPAINTSRGTTFGYTWASTPITSFPLINTSKGTYFGGTWYNCQELVEFPRLDLSNGESFYSAWSQCFNLESFPSVDLSKGVNFNSAWNACSSLTSFPGDLDLSSGNNFESAWSACSSLTSFPGTLDLSSGTNFVGAWGFCTSLTSFPGTLDLSSGTDFRSAWISCTSLTAFPGTLNLSSGTDFDNAWSYCTSLTAFPAGMFDSCSATIFSFAWYNCALSQQSVDNILVSINAAGQNNGTLGIFGGTSAAPSAVGLAAKASLEAKGWTVVTN